MGVDSRFNNLAQRNIPPYPTPSRPWTHPVALKPEALLGIQCYDHNASPH